MTRNDLTGAALVFVSVATGLLIILSMAIVVDKLYWLGVT